MFKVGMFKMHPPLPEHLSEEAKTFIRRLQNFDVSKKSYIYKNDLFNIGVLNLIL